MTVWMHHLNITYGEKARWETTQECYMLFWTNPGSNTPQNSSCTVTHLPSHKPLNKTNKNAGHCWRNSLLDSYTWTCQCWPTSKDWSHTLALCGHWMQSRKPTGNKSGDLMMKISTFLFIPWGWQTVSLSEAWSLESMMSLLHSHYSQVHFDSVWLYLLSFHLGVKQIFLKIISMRWESLKPYNYIQTNNYRQIKKSNF